MSDLRERAADEDVSFQDAVAALHRWIGKEVRIDVGSRAADSDLGAIVGTTLERIDELSEDERTHPGAMHAVTLTDSRGGEIASLVVAEELFEGGHQSADVLILYLGGVHVFIQSMS